MSFRPTTNGEARAFKLALLTRLTRLTLSGSLAFAFAAAATAQTATPASAKKLADLQPKNDYAYLVKPGDTLIGLGEKLLTKAVDWAQVGRYNRLANNNRIAPGSTLQIPVNLLRSTPYDSTLLQARGEVNDVKGQPLKAGVKLSEGDEIKTGKDGVATVQLIDGSIITLRNNTAAKLEQTRTYSAPNVTTSIVRIAQGRAEALVTKLTPGASRFELRSATAIAGVRGTQFRINADADAGNFKSEVLEGGVALEGNDPKAAVALAAGQGSLVDKSGTAQPAVALLAAPALNTAEALQERPVSRFRFPALPGASGYRGQIATDAAFREMLTEQIFTTPDVRIADLNDGAYFVRVRAIDALGLEGKDAALAFTLKARPEPPLTQAPANKGKVRGTEAVFTWLANPDAKIYHFELAEDPDFARIVERKQLPGTEFQSKTIPFGQYFWRVRSIAAKNGADDLGPWNDTQVFDLRPPPAAPEPPSEGEGKLGFNWGGEAGQTFKFELARDDKFANIVSKAATTEPKTFVPRPDPGTYYVRVQATDPDGFVGPYTKPQRIVIINQVTSVTGVRWGSGAGGPMVVQ